jgi:putative ABC transport system permease protein
MNILDNIELAISSLLANKVRALLTMLGIIIGISSVIAIVSVGDSMTASITDSMSSFGVNSMTVSVKEKTEDDSEDTRMFGGSNPTESDLISDQMILDYTQAYGEYIEAISLSNTVGSSIASSGTVSEDVNISGTNADYLVSNNIIMTTGRYIKDDDLDLNVVVIADVMATSLFAKQDPVGEEIVLAINEVDTTFIVVGVYEYEEKDGVVNTTTTTTYDTYIPISTAKKYTDADSGYRMISVSVDEDVDMSTFMLYTENFFGSYYNQNPDFTVGASSMESMIETVNTMLSTVSMAIAAIAAISLLVGGIGVMNIMLVSITERTKEIGTRIAIGARRNSIRIQFIVEAIIICVIGGIIGIILGEIVGYYGSSMLGYASTPKLSIVVYAVAFSMAIGIFFGYYPANKAAKMNPIDALRYE